MVSPISGDLGTTRAVDLDALASDSSKLLVAADAALLTGAPLSEEAATLLDLVAQTAAQTEQTATIDAVMVAQNPAALAADTVAISPEALAQAAAIGLPALLYDTTPVYPRPLERRRPSAEGDLDPASGVQHWQNAIQLFRENESDPPPQRRSLSGAMRICSFCGKVHATAADPSLGEEDICSVSFTASDEQSAKG
jgi:hypothetical protein